MSRGWILTHKDSQPIHLSEHDGWRVEQVIGDRAKAAEQESDVQDATVAGNSPSVVTPEPARSSESPVSAPFLWPAGTRPIYTETLGGDVVIMDDVEDAPLLTIKGHNGVSAIEWLAALPSLPAEGRATHEQER